MVKVERVVEQNIYSHVDCLPCVDLKLQYLVLRSFLAQELLRHHVWVRRMVDFEVLILQSERDSIVFSINPVKLLVCDVSKVHGYERY